MCVGAPDGAIENARPDGRVEETGALEMLPHSLRVAKTWLNCKDVGFSKTLVSRTRDSGVQNRR